MMYKEIKECLACGNMELIPTLDLGNQPLANSYLKDEMEFSSENSYPLQINRCSKCYHVQLSVAVDPDEMFRNYLYVSGTSNTLRKYFEWFVKYTVEYYNNINDVDINSILDIGCNDGTLLDYYKSVGISTYGVDPAKNLFNATSKRHNILCDYFDKNSSKQLGVNFDIISAQNVFAHNDNPLNFLESLKQVMHNKSLAFIQTSQANLILNNEYDSIYHEHHSFFNILSMQKLCQRAQLFLIDVIKTPIHGISYLFIVSKNKNLVRPNHIQNLIEMERYQGLYNDSTYISYEQHCHDSSNRMNDIVTQYRNNGYKVIGYGAAAKGNTVLNFTKIKLDYILDDNPLKYDYYTPGMHVYIGSIDILDKYDENDKILFIPLAWNFFAEIKNKIKNKRNNSNDKFMTYFPEIKIV